MKFVVEDGIVNEEEKEILSKKYHKHLKEESVEDLLELAEEVEKSKTQFNKIIYTLSLENAIRLALEKNDYGICKKIIESTEEDEILEGKMEYFEKINNPISAVFTINRILKKKSDSLLIRKREKIRQKYCINVKKDVHVEKEYAGNCVYSLLWQLFRLIEKKRIENVSHIVVSGRDMKNNLWIDCIERWMGDLGLPFSTKHLFISLDNNTSSNYNKSKNRKLSLVKSDFTTYTFTVPECAKKVLEAFSSGWSGDLFYTDESLSFYLAYIFVLDYLPPDKITDKILTFVYEHLSLSNAVVLDRHRHLNITSCITRIVQKVLLCSKNIKYNPMHIIHKVRLNASASVCMEEEKALNLVLYSYLIGEANSTGILEILSKNPFFDISINMPLHLKVLERASAEADPNTALVCISIIRGIPVSGCMELFRHCSSAAQSFFLSRVIDNPNIPAIDKKNLFQAIPSPAKEMFTYNNAVNLLLASSEKEDAHLSFFSYFIKPKYLLAPNTVYTFTGKKLLLSSNIFIRSVCLVKKYLKHPQKMYINSISITNPIYSKFLTVFLYRKEYEYCLAIDPFKMYIYVGYTKYLYKQIFQNQQKNRLTVENVYEICKKIANVFILCSKNIFLLENKEEIRSVFVEGLSILLSLSLKQKKRPKNLLKNTLCTKKTYSRLKKSLACLRSQCNIYPELSPPFAQPSPVSSNTILTQSPSNLANTAYNSFLLYDLWRISNFSGKLPNRFISIVQYAIERINLLHEVEFDYLIRIRVVRLKESFWDLSFLAEHEDTSRLICIKQRSTDNIYTQYIRYLLLEEKNVSLFLFNILKEYRNINQLQVEEIIEKMFFDQNNNLILDFPSWIPNMSVLYRRDYFDYLFAFLEENNPKVLKEVKNELKKKGFIIA